MSSTTKIDSSYFWHEEYKRSVEAFCLIPTWIKQEWLEPELKKKNPFSSFSDNDRGFVTSSSSLFCRLVPEFRLQELRKVLGEIDVEKLSSVLVPCMDKRWDLFVFGAAANFVRKEYANEGKRRERNKEKGDYFLRVWLTGGLAPRENRDYLRKYLACCYADYVCRIDAFTQAAAVVLSRGRTQKKALKAGYEALIKVKSVRNVKDVLREGDKKRVFFSSAGRTFVPKHLQKKSKRIGLGMAI